MGEAAKVARIRFLEEELKDVKSRIADHTRRVTARLDALAARVDKLESSSKPRSTLLEQRVDEMSEDLDEQLGSLEKRLEALERDDEGPKTETMVAPAILDEAELEARLDARIEEKLAQLQTPAPKKAKKAKKAKKKDADELTEVKGIGPASAKKLRSKGVNGPSDVAGWTDETIDALHESLGIAKKRLKEWRTAAKKL